LLLTAVLPLSPASAQISVGISVHIAPPILPVYVQPACPEPGFIWTPGYWAWSDGGYYWVPGTWIAPPAVGLLWTPGYWGWGGGAYLWHAGYWGPHVGFYGGVNYGFGYGGVGFVGGEWRGGAFFYNRAVANVTNVHVNVYNNVVVNNTTVNRVSFNGGAGGIAARPTAAEMQAEHDHHVVGTALQMQHEQQASHNEAMRASVNGGRPSIAATGRPGEFSGHGVVAANGGGEHHPGPGAEAHGGAGGARPAEHHAGPGAPHAHAEEHHGGGGHPAPHPAAHHEKR
jgi:hypothetical protein